MSQKIEILGVTVTIRPRTKRAGYEARFTWNRKPVTCSALSPEAAAQKATEYLQIAQNEAGKQTSAALADDLGYWLAATLGPIFSQSTNQNTREKNLWALGQVAPPCNGLKISTLTVADVVMAWQRIQRANPNAHTQRTLYGILRRGLDRLTRARRIAWNYMEDVPVPPVPRRTNLLPAHAAFRFWHDLHVSGDYLAPKVFLCLVLGLRDDEATGILVEDLTDRELMVRGTKTANAYRTIHLSPGIAWVLAGYAKRARRWLCETPDGHRLPSGSTKAINARYRRAGLGVTGWHCLRHAMGEIESGAGAAPSIRMAILGQSTKGIQGLYVHPTPENMRESLAKWESYLATALTERLPADLGTQWVRPVRKPKQPAAK